MQGFGYISLLIFAGTVSCLHALGQPVFTAAAGPCGPINSPVPVDTGVCVTSGGCAGTGGQFAWSRATSSESGPVAWTSQTRYGGWNSCGGGWQSRADAALATWVVFTGPGSFVSTTLQLDWEAEWQWSVSGSVPNVWALAIGGSAFSQALNNFSIGVGEGESGVSSAQGGWDGSYTDPHAQIVQVGPRHYRGTGWIIARPTPAHWTHTLVELNRPIYVSLGSIAHMHNGDIGAGTQEISVEVRILPPVDRPVFDLPPGYDANSTDGRIVNNRWVLPRPVITQQPAHALICPGGTTSFAVAATSQTSMSYQWLKGGAPLTDGGAISGATTSTLTITGAQLADQDSYSCVVSNVHGGTNSGPATLSICVADFDCSGSLSVQDLFEYLAGYFSGDPRSDVNASGELTVQDIFDFLAAYFAGCGA